MKLAVLVIGDGRPHFLAETVGSIAPNVLHPITARLMVNDEADPAYCAWLDEALPEWEIVHTGRRGMAGAVQAGFDLCLSHDPDYVLWLEEDMALVRPLPIAQAIGVLDAHHELAQMCFKREAIDPSEGDDQLTAIVERAANWGEKASYTWHDYIFSMNPCLIPKRVLELGWPSGPLGIGNESGMTYKLTQSGYVFGQWGHRGDAPWARHIGYAVRSVGYRL